MLQSLRINQYRAFRSLEMEGLTPVTLLVGANNSGKSSVLEAVEALLGGGSARSLALGPSRRGEVLLTNIPDDSRPRREVDLSHLFFGHKMTPGSRFRIEGNESEARPFVECEVVPGSDEELSEIDARQESPLTHGLNEVEPLTLEISSDRGKERIQLTSSGKIRSSPFRPRIDTDKNRPPVTFLDSVRDVNIEGMWDRVVLTPEEQQVLDGLRIIEPAIERIAAVGKARYGDYDMMVKVAGADRPFPLGSMGDGIRHLLALSLCLVTSANGYLLVDEIDTGLHYSVMEKMWKMVAETSQRLKVQVIASTHSLDCLNSLARFYEASPNIRDTISLHRLEKGQERTVCYSAEELFAAAEQSMEVR